MLLLILVDKHYPADATVELVFSGSPAQKRGADSVMLTPTLYIIPVNGYTQALLTEVCLYSGEEIQKKDPRGSPNVSCTDPVVRWDSYENFNFHHEDSIEGTYTHNIHKLDCFRSVK